MSAFSGHRIFARAFVLQDCLLKTADIYIIVIDCIRKAECIQQISSLYARTFVFQDCLLLIGDICFGAIVCMHDQVLLTDTVSMHVKLLLTADVYFAAINHTCFVSNHWLLLIDDIYFGLIACMQLVEHSADTVSMRVMLYFKTGCF